MIKVRGGLNSAIQANIRSRELGDDALSADIDDDEQSEFSNDFNNKT